MVFRTASHMVSSHQTRDLECSADGCSIPWNLPIISHPDLIAAMQQTHLLLLCALLSQQSHFVSDLCGVDVQWFQERSSGLAKFQGIVSVNDFRLPIRLQELLQAPFGFLKSFCFARIRLDPWSSQVLHLDCKSMIVSRFTPFTNNFVIGCNQITKNFCMRYHSANTSSARGPCDFGVLADLAISVFREMSINTVLAQVHTSHRFWRWFMRRTRVWVSVFRNSFLHKILSEFLQPFWYVGIRASPYLFVILIFIWFWNFSWFM